MQVDIHASGVGFGRVLQAEFLADLFDFRLYFLDVVGGVVAFAYYAVGVEGVGVSVLCCMVDVVWYGNLSFAAFYFRRRMDCRKWRGEMCQGVRAGETNIHMQMRLSGTLRISNPLLQDPFRLLHILSMQIDRVAIDSPDGIVFTENVIRGLLIVRVHHCAVAFAFFGELVRGRAVAALVGLLGLLEGWRV